MNSKSPKETSSLQSIVQKIEEDDLEFRDDVDFEAVLKSIVWAKPKIDAKFED